MRLKFILLCLVLMEIPTFAAPVSISLPAETAKLKPSTLPGYQLATQKCLICHSADLISQQPPQLTMDQWSAEVKKMQHAYGAPLDDNDIAVISEYLGVTYGSAKSKNLGTARVAVKSPVKQTNDVQSLLAKNACLACHAVDHAVVGPAYNDVAKKYHDDPNALATVSAHIRSGGTGRWGANTMPPFLQLTEAEAKMLAAFVLKK